MISRSDEQHAAAADDPAPASKTRRKHEMHALQDLGQALIALDPRRLRELELPERLAARVDSLFERESLPVALTDSPLPAMSTKVGRNEPCPCGSGEKHKRCCLS